MGLVSLKLGGRLAEHVYEAIMATHITSGIVRADNPEKRAALLAAAWSIQESCAAVLNEQPEDHEACLYVRAAECVAGQLEQSGNHAIRIPEMAPDTALRFAEELCHALPKEFWQGVSREVWATVPERLQNLTDLIQDLLQDCAGIVPAAEPLEVRYAA